MQKTIRQERIERLIADLRQEVFRGVIERDIPTRMSARFSVPVPDPHFPTVTLFVEIYPETFQTTPRLSVVAGTEASPCDWKGEDQ